jgi:hypothetical protein
MAGLIRTLCKVFPLPIGLAVRAAIAMPAKGT